MHMSEIADLERSRSADEAVKKSTRSREALCQASYYHHRAAAHRAMAQRAKPGVAAVHRELAWAYLAAAIATERGETVDFAGGHRAEWRETLPQPTAGRPSADLCWASSPGAPLSSTAERLSLAGRGPGPAGKSMTPLALREGRLPTWARDRFGSAA
jgi:hypothetical protein